MDIALMLQSEQRPSNRGAGGAKAADDLRLNQPGARGKAAPNHQISKLFVRLMSAVPANGARRLLPAGWSHEWEP